MSPTTRSTVPLSRTDPVVRFLSDRWGGPAGSRLAAPDAQGGRNRSWLTVPRILVGLTVISILLAALSNQFCRINGWGGISVYHYGCYSDVSALWGSRDFDQSAWAPFLEQYSTFEYPALTMFLASIVAAITHGLDSMAASATPEDPGIFYWAGRTGLLYWDLTFLLAAAAWIVLVLATMQAAGRRRWDAVIVATSPAIIFGIGINWDIFPAAALTVAIICAQQRRWVAAGVLIGVGVSLKLYPLFMLGALVTLTLRKYLRNDTSGTDEDIDLQTLGRFSAAAATTWLAINLPAMLISLESWAEFWVFSSQRGAGYSSIWHVWMTLAKTGPSAETVSALSFGLFAASCVGILILGLTAPVPPRMVQLLFLIVAAFVVFNKVYSPQFMIWLIPLIALAAPRIRDVIIWQGFQILHFWAIWMYLAAMVGEQEPQHSFDSNLYVLAVLGHLLATAYIAGQVIWDMYQPDRDVVRLSP